MHCGIYLVLVSNMAADVFFLKKTGMVNVSSQQSSQVKMLGWNEISKEKSASLIVLVIRQRAFSLLLTLVIRLVWWVGVKRGCG